MTLDQLEMLELLERRARPVHSDSRVNRDNPDLKEVQGRRALQVNKEIKDQLELQDRKDNPDRLDL